MNTVIIIIFLKNKFCGSLIIPTLGKKYNNTKDNNQFVNENNNKKP